MISLTERLKIKEEALEKKFDNFDFELRVCSPGLIVSFDAEKQTAVVQLAIKELIKCDSKEFFEEFGDNSASIPVALLVDVPICIPSAGGFHVTLPIKPGDECLVVFGDTCIDNWWEFGCEDGEPKDQKSLRRHDLSDGFAICGVKSQPKVIEMYNPDAIELRNITGDNKVQLSDAALIMQFGETNKITMSEAGIEILGVAVTIAGPTTIDEKIFLDHKHMGVIVGGANTQGVV